MALQQRIQVTIYASFFLISLGHVWCQRNCGKSLRTGIEGYVVNGEDAKQGDWPWMVALTELNENTREHNPICTGFLIDNNHVISAAHCFQRNASFYSTRIGHVNLTLGKVYPIRHIAIHEEYEKGRFYEDIALVTLSRNVDIPNFNPVCLPPRRALRNLTARGTTFVGWGSTRASARMSHVLKQLDTIPVRSNEYCNDIWEKCVRLLPHGITPRMICAGFEDEPGKDLCWGDSGGPLMVREQNRWYAVGVAAFGYSCGRPGYPGVYTRLSEYLNWIHRTNTTLKIQENQIPKTLPDNSIERRGGTTENKIFKIPKTLPDTSEERIDLTVISEEVTENEIPNRIPQNSGERIDLTETGKKSPGFKEECPKPNADQDMCMDIRECDFAVSVLANGAKPNICGWVDDKDENNQPIKWPKVKCGYPENLRNSLIMSFVKEEERQSYCGILHPESKEKGAWPWMVRLKGESLFYIHFPCVGAMIDRRNFIVQAICFYGFRPSNVTAKIGDVKTSETYEVTTIKTFHEKSEEWDSGIALGTLARDVEDPDFNPICLPDTLQDINLTGMTVINIDLLPNQTTNNTYIISNNKCRQELRKKHLNKNLERHICTNYSLPCKSKDVLMIQNQGKWHLFGFPEDLEGNCKEYNGVPNVYTKISEYQNWILENAD